MIFFSDQYIKVLKYASTAPRLVLCFARTVLIDSLGLVRRLAVILCRAPLSSIRLWRVCRQRRLLLPEIPGTGARGPPIPLNLTQHEVSNASCPKMGLKNYRLGDPSAKPWNMNPSL